MTRERERENQRVMNPKVFLPTGTISFHTIWFGAVNKHYSPMYIEYRYIHIGEFQ